MAHRETHDLLTDALVLTLEEMGAEAERQWAALDTELSCEPSPEHNRTMTALLTGESARQKRPLTRSPWARTAACIALAVILSATLFRTQTTAVWRWLFRAMIDDSQGHAHITFFDRREWMRTRAEEEGWVIEDILYPMQQPPGYVLNDFWMTPSRCELGFSDGEHDLRFYQTVISPSMFQGIDTENAEVSHIPVGDYEAMLVQKWGWSTLFFHDDIYTYYISGNGLTADELTHLVEEALQTM